MAGIFDFNQFHIDVAILGDVVQVLDNSNGTVGSVSPWTIRWWAIWFQMLVGHHFS